MADKDKLNSMIDSLINDKPEEAQIAFHDYLGTKMRVEIQGVHDEAPKTETDE